MQNSPVLHLGEYAIRPLGACKSGDTPPPAARIGNGKSVGICWCNRKAFKYWKMIANIH